MSVLLQAMLPELIHFIVPAARSLIITVSKSRLGSFFAEVNLLEMSTVQLALLLLHCGTES